MRSGGEWLRQGWVTLRALRDTDAVREPVVVVWDKELGLAFIIVSKCACSALKRAIVRRHVPDFSIGFPAIHLVDLAKLTHGAVERHAFHSRRALDRFVRDKTCIAILRDPVARFMSFYTDVARGKNRFYESLPLPPRLRQVAGVPTPRAFGEIVMRVPDALADRHTRSQTFWLPDSGARALHLLRLDRLTADWMLHPALAPITPPAPDNVNPTYVDAIVALTLDPRWRARILTRYAADDARLRGVGQGA